MNDFPSARGARGPSFDIEREKLRRVAAEKGLGGLANDTKWDELIEWALSNDTYRPTYRFKCIDREDVSRWDSEWQWHLPYPLSAVEWMDLAFLQPRPHGRLLPPLDHSAIIEEALKRIGLEYMKGKIVIRVFGYAPKNLVGIDEEA